MIRPLRKTVSFFLPSPIFPPVFPLALLSAGLMLALLQAVPANAQDSAGNKPSFDCAVASSEAEKIVCADPALMAIDRRLAERYAEATKVLETIDAGSKEALAELRATQRGWIGGRDDCWKADDKPACVKDLYLMREANLVARYGLDQPSATATYVCDGNPANELVAAFFDTELAGVRLEYGDDIDTGTQSRTASGARYDASFGRYLWTKGDEATFVWDQTKQPVECRVK